MKWSGAVGLILSGIALRLLQDYLFSGNHSGVAQEGVKEPQTKPLEPFKDFRVVTESETGILSAGIHPTSQEEIRQYIARYSAGTTYMQQMVLYNEHWKPYLTRDMYTPGYSFPNSGICPRKGEGIILLTLIISGPDKISNRNYIRQMHKLQERPDFKIAFLMGVPGTEEHLEAMKAENDEFGDIIINNIRDVYPHLALKTLSALNWFNEFCSEAQFLQKMDDDVFTNYQKTLQFLSGFHGDTSVIFGNKIPSPTPVYSTIHYCHTTPEQYNQTFFPQYLAGPTYIISRAATRPLFNCAMKATYFPVEDVWITGIIATRCKVPTYHAHVITQWNFENVMFCDRLMNNVAYTNLAPEKHLSVFIRTNACAKMYPSYHTRRLNPKETNPEGEKRKCSDLEVEYPNAAMNLQLCKIAKQKQDANWLGEFGSKCSSSWEFLAKFKANHCTGYWCLYANRNKETWTEQKLRVCGTDSTDGDNVAAQQNSECTLMKNRFEAITNLNC